MLVFKSSKYNYQFYMKNRNRSLNYRQDAVQINQWSFASNTPKSSVVRTFTRDSKDINPQFINILDKNKRKVFNELIRGARGRNNPINYEEDFQFLQRWQTLNKQNDFHNVNYEMPENLLSLIFNVLQLIQKIIVIWFVSVYRIYDLTQYHWPFILGLFFVSINCIWKIVITAKHYSSIKKYNNPNFNSSQHFKSLAHVFIYDTYTLIYYSILIIFDQIHNDFLGFLAFDFLAGVFEYQKGELLYKKIKLYGIRSPYRNYMNLFDLMSNLFIIFHFCAILIYSLTLYSENNWLDNVQGHPSQWYSCYLYSIYFTSTTMLTVGYGDILPTNKIEIFTIVFIQVLGTAINGYIFSQVGHTLAKIRYKRQTQEKDISDTEKLAKVYRLDTELAKKMRQYIMHNEMENQQLNIDEENNLLHKLNDELRTEVNNFNHMQIIKENIFFLFYFSKKAQIQFAKRLQRKLFSPNESIYQLHGKEKLWIVTKGKLQIYTDRKQGMRFYCKKKLKQINKMEKKQISDNIFGYSSIICGKPTNLRAITKDFTVIYNLQKSQILEVIHDDSNDFESFCELKERINLEKYPERWQVPRITSIREHYCPSIFFLIKKEKSMMRKINTKQRKQMIRSDRRCRPIRPIGVQNFNIVSQENSSDDSFHSSQNVIPIDQTSAKVIDLEERKQKYSKIMELESRQFTLKSIVPRSYKRKYVNNKKYDERHREELIEKWHFSKQSEKLDFQVSKNYNSFFKKRNLSEVIKKLKKKDTIETQLTMIGETMGPFHPRRTQRGKLSCNI